MARIGVLTVSYNSSDLLERNLAPLLRGLPQADLVVWDNSSDPDERRECRRLVDEHGWLHGGEGANLGFGVGTNRAADIAVAHGCDLLLLLNPDARISPTSVRVLAEATEADPTLLAAPRLFDATGNPRSSGHYLRLTDGRMTRSTRSGDLPPAPGLAPWLGGACLMISTQLWHHVGGMPEEYFLYWEDVEFSWRVVAAGGTLRILDSATLQHDQGGTHGRRRGSTKSSLYVYYNLRNRLLFAHRNLDRETQQRWLRATPVAAREVLRRGGRAQLVRRPTSAMAAVRGYRDGRASLGHR